MNLFSHTLQLFSIFQQGAGDANLLSFSPTAFIITNIRSEKTEYFSLLKKYFSESDPDCEIYFKNFLNFVVSIVVSGSGRFGFPG
jgi:hypothetical protein